MNKKLYIFGIEITDISREELINTVINMAKSCKNRRIFYVNVHALNIAYRCPRFRSLLSSADLVFNDGYGVNVASALIGKRLDNRNTPPDWIDELAKIAISNGVAFFFLGDEDFVVSKAKHIMAERHPNLRIVGIHHGFFTKNGVENNVIVSKINATSPHILFVGMGMPTQEFWIDDNIDSLNVNVYLSVGALFRWYSGIEERAPKWITDHGFEWLARLASHPVKHFKRYVIGNAIFFIRFVKTALLKHELPSTCNKPILPYCSNKCEFFKVKN